MARKTYRNRLRKVTQWAPGLLLSLTLFSCLLRCAECAKASNIILIVTDDLDVELGGMVSSVFFLKKNSFEDKRYINDKDIPIKHICFWNFTTDTLKEDQSPDC